MKKIMLSFIMLYIISSNAIENSKQTFDIQQIRETFKKVFVYLQFEWLNDINSQDDNGWTPLMIASSKGLNQTVEYLIENGADIDMKDKYGKNALMVAAANGCQNAVEYLIEKGANITLKDKYGRTALEYADLKGHKNIVELLKNKINLLSCNNSLFDNKF